MVSLVRGNCAKDRLGRSSAGQHSLWRCLSRCRLACALNGSIYFPRFHVSSRVKDRPVGRINALLCAVEVSAFCSFMKMISTVGVLGCCLSCNARFNGYTILLLLGKLSNPAFFCGKQPQPRECAVIFEPISMRETWSQGVGHGTKEEGQTWAGSGPAASDRSGSGVRQDDVGF